MKNWLKNLLIIVASLGLAIIIGCSAMMDGVTPAVIEPEAADYAGRPIKKFMPYTSLLDAQRIDAWVDYVHLKRQASFAREAEDDLAWVSFLKDRAAFHKANAMQFQQMVFSPEGPIGLLFPSLFAGTLGALLIKRPGDKSKKEIETEEKIKNNS